ncbi:MAG: SH3 domain-containing protein [Rhodomicrobium sp.]
MTKAPISCGILAAITLAWAIAASAEESPGRKVGSVTGLAIPRFVSLKASEVNSRVGPGSEYQIAWVFKRAGLPVEILAEFENWRQVRDSDGVTGWAASSLLSARRTALVAPWVKAHTVFTLTSSRGGASEVARIEPGAIVDIISCDGEACEVYAGQQKGWVPQKNLWGVYPGEIVK